VGDAVLVVEAAHDVAAVVDAEGLGRGRIGIVD
jgi:hypothetical protein